MGTILNWIAQGVMVAAAAGFGLWLLPAGRARARLRVWWTVIGVVISLPLVTWWSATEGAAPPIGAGGIEPLVVVPQSVWNATSVAVAAWIAWICLNTLRLGLDLRALARIRRRCHPTGPSTEGRLRPSTRARLVKWGAQLMESSDIRAAAVLGFGPPIIAIQPALLLHLTNDELDQVVIHEWAHVARRDALGTLVQQLVHVLAGWHPAVWAALGRLRMEREMACDEVVVDATGSAKAYAACLTRVAGLAQTSRGSHLAVAMLSSPGLTRRVMRLLARRRTPAFAPYWMVTPAVLAVVVAFASGQLSFVGVQLGALPSIEREVRGAAQTLAPRLASVAAVVAPAREGAASPHKAPRQERAQHIEPRATEVPAAALTAAPMVHAAANVIDSTPEPAAAPPMASDVPAPPEVAANEPPAPEPAAPLAAPLVNGTKDAWAAATQMGESIGRSSRKSAVSTAGFFTRISKRVATSF